MALIWVYADTPGHWRPACDACAQQGYGAGNRAHAAIAAGAEEIEQATDLQRHLAREDIVQGQIGVGVREVDPPFSGGVARRQRELVGGVAAAEEGCKEGEEEGAQDVLQAQFSHRARGAGTGGALRPAVGENIHLVSLY